MHLREELFFMDKQVYFSPEIDIVFFETTDIITSSDETPIK